MLLLLSGLVEHSFRVELVLLIKVIKVVLGSFIIHNQLLRLIINYYVYYCIMCVLYGHHTLGNGIDPDQETNGGVFSRYLSL